MSEQLAYDLDVLCNASCYVEDIADSLIDMGYQKLVWTPGHKLPPKLGQRVLIHFEGRTIIITYKKDYFEKGEEFYWMPLPKPPKQEQGGKQ